MLQAIEFIDNINSVWEQHKVIHNNKNRLSQYCRSKKIDKITALKDLIS